MRTIENCVVSLLFLVLAVYFPSQRYQADLERILHGLLKEEEFPSRNQQNRVAIGFGSCLDIVTDGLELLKRMEVEPPESPAHHEIISSQDKLAEAFAFFFQRGSAAECVKENNSRHLHYYKEELKMSFI